MNKHIEELKKAAKAIGYEKWITDGAGEVATVDYVGEDGVITGDHVCNCEAVNGESENATFIALANPARILDLIRQLEAAEKERDEFRRSYENAHTEWHEAQENYDSAKRELTLERHRAKTLLGTVDIVNQQRDHWMERAKAAEVRGLDVVLDANRYRFIRDKDCFGEQDAPGLVSADDIFELDTGDFDAAIDARMAASDIPFFNPVTSFLSAKDSEWRERAEARLLVPVKLPPRKSAEAESEKYPDMTMYEAMMREGNWNDCIFECEKAIRAAGYPVEGGE